jgi:nucleotide-binding universal stress UspA family protein
MERPFDRLLLATEHTEFDAGAERLALAMAARCGLPLAGVIPLVSNPEYEAVAPQLAARKEAEAMVRIASLQGLADAAGVEIAVQVRRGEELWPEIVAEARERGADLLITRRRGKHSFLANLLVGDMVSKVAAHAPCNVLMVPRHGHMWQRGIVAAIDASSTGERVAAVAIGVAAQCGLPLILVHVTGTAQAPSATPPLAAAVDQAQAAGVQATAEIVAGKVHEPVIACLQRSGADLLIVGLRSDDAIEKFSLGPNARKLIAVAETPVLIVKP